MQDLDLHGYFHDLEGVLHELLVEPIGVLQVTEQDLHYFGEGGQVEGNRARIGDVHDVFNGLQGLGCLHVGF